MSMKNNIKPFKSFETKAPYEIEIKKSVFITEAKMVLSTDEASEFIDYIRKKHPKATHNVIAYRISHGGLQEKADDDGEPAGTSAMPILNAIKYNDLTNVVVVVTRYFGGIKLGAGGLSRAYMSATTGAIEASGIREFKEYQNFKISLTYDLYDIVLNYLNNNKIKILSNEFKEKVEIQLTVPIEDYEELYKYLINLISARAQIEKGDVVLR